jgi:hypothetical protein
MATATTNTVLDHTSDAGFRAWVAEFISLFTTGGGMVQTNDTGQIDTATVTRPAVNTDGGYAVFRFNDSLQATAPYFVRFDFGTDNIADRPRLRITIGTGSNGAGTITGVLRAATQIGCTGEPNSTSTPYLSRACGFGGSITLAFKIGAIATSGWQYIGLHRVRDAAGEQTADGLVFVWGHRVSGNDVTAAMESYRRVNPATFGGTTSNNFCLVPLLTATSAAPSGPTRSYRHFTALPDPRPMIESLTVIRSECVAGTEFDARPVGSVDHHYVSLGVSLRGCAAGTSFSDTTYGFAMIWE